MKRFISLLLAVLVLLSSAMALTAVNIFAASGTISYSFSNTNAGYAQGTITLKADNGTYWLYWADDTKALADYGEITSLTVSGGQGSFAMPKYTAIPAAATKLIAINSGSEPAVANRTVAKASAVYSIAASKQLNSKLLYTFGAISDPQLANDSYGSGSYPYDEVHLAAALETLAKRGVDFTVSSGDTVNDQNNASYASEYKSYQQILADSTYAAPIYESLGNHDVGTAWDKNGNHYNNNAPFIKATGLDSKKATINAGKPYFEVTEPTTGDHFIFMALEGGFYTNKGTQFSTAQLDWLEGLLKKYKDDGKNIFIIEHANITGWGSGDKLTEPYYYDLALIKSNPDVSRFVKLMETYKDCVIITGHTHLELSAQYNYSDNNGTSAVMMHNSAIGGVRRLVNGSVDRTAVKGLSEGYIVEVYEDAILFNGTNMYYNESMPQCTYIIPMGTSENEGGGSDVDIPTEPVSDNITITLKDETNEGWMANNASEREIQLIDNKTNTKYIMTSYDGYKTWTVEVPREVTDITFKRVRMSDSVVRNQWDAGERNGSVQYCVLDDTGNGTTVGAGYWNASVTEPAKPVVTKPVETEPKETTVPTKPVETEPKETTAPVIVPTTTTDAAEIPTSAIVTEPADALAPVVIITELANGNLLVEAYAADGDDDVEYQFAISGTVYQAYSAKSSFVCNIPFDNKYVVTVSAKYADGTEHKTNVEFEIKNGQAILPEMPEAPTKPVGSTPADTTTETAATTTQEPAFTITVPVTGGVQEYMYGDADLNGKINVKDATTVQKYAAKLADLDDVAFVQADVTGDTKVNVKDATAIQKYVAKIIAIFPVETDEDELVILGADYSAQQDLEDYYTYSSYDQYMALKKATLTSATQSVIAACQTALYNIAGARPSESSNNITVYFTNTNNWSTVYAHIWGTGGDKASWPGTTMTYVKNDSNGKGVYKVTLDYSLYQKIIFTNNSEQTIDISLSGENNVGYYLNGQTSGKYNVSTYAYN